MSTPFQQWKLARNEALRTLDLVWARDCFPNASSDDVLLAAMHKARYDCVGIEDALRHDSARWLRERGLGALGGRPLLPEGQLPEGTL
jgi:hypothetical protein